MSDKVKYDRKRLGCTVVYTNFGGSNLTQSNWKTKKTPEPAETISRCQIAKHIGESKMKIQQ